MSKTAKIVLLSLAGVVVLCCGGGIVAIKLYLKGAKAASIAPATYDAIHDGDAEADVRRRLPANGTAAKEALSGGEPAAPAGATCAYAVNGTTIGEWSPTVYRFCFAGGRLVEKRTITVPSPQ